VFTFTECIYIYIVVIVVIVQYGAAKRYNVVSYTKSCYTKTCFSEGFILFSSVEFGRFGRID